MTFRYENNNYPSSQYQNEISSLINDPSSRPRCLIEIDKMLYVKGLKPNYAVYDFIDDFELEDIDAFTGTNLTVTANSPIMPVKKFNTLALTTANITSVYGAKESFRENEHKGLDIDAELNDEIVASWEGRVIFADMDNTHGAGNVVRIDSGNGYIVRYAHLNKILVKKGQYVSAGEVIGLAGTTGRSTGVHLHLGMTYKSNTNFIDPLPFLKGEQKIKTNVVTTAPTSEKKEYKFTAKTDSSFYRDFDKTQKFTDIFIDHADVQQFPKTISGKIRKFVGFKNIYSANQVKSFKIVKEFFNEGFFDFVYYANMQSNDMKLTVKLYTGISDTVGKTLLTINGGQGVGEKGLVHPKAVYVPRGKNTLEFIFTSTSIANGEFGLNKLTMKTIRQVRSKKDSEVTDYSLNDIKWVFNDNMSNASKWLPLNTTVYSENNYLQFSRKSGISDLLFSGISRNSVVQFPITLNFKLKLSASATEIELIVAGGTKKVIPRFTKTSILGTNNDSFAIDNTLWNEFLFVIDGNANGKLFVKDNTLWVDTGLILASETATTNRIIFNTKGGTVSVDDVKYVYDYYQFPMQETVKTQFIESGHFAFEQTFYLENEILQWEINESINQSISTASITLDNSKGIFSPNYNRNLFPKNTEESPYSYYEEGQFKHVLSEGTPIRFYVGYGNNLIRRFTGLIKGEITENSADRTVSFNCVDMYDILNETRLFKNVYFSSSNPLVSGADGESLRSYWIKSDAVEYLIFHSPLKNWRYQFEDLRYPDYIVEQTVYTSIDYVNRKVYKFNNNGTLEVVDFVPETLINGHTNPYYVNTDFSVGERLSDCIVKLIEDIDYRAYCDWYGTFRLEKISKENNKKWEFVEGENLYSLNSSTDYSRTLNHLMIWTPNTKNNPTHFIDNSLLISSKGNYRSAGIEIKWIDDLDYQTAYDAKKSIADHLFFEMKAIARTKNVVVKGNPLIKLYDGCYIYDSNTSTTGYYLIKGNKLSGDSKGITSSLEISWSE